MTGAEVYDICVVGGGINGCGVARDAAGRGFSVCLAEMNDLASGTSSWSTKLIHGGLRYLEHYEFRLVREALQERELLWANAPHIIRPLRFVLPHHAGLRPAWLLRLGLFLYDHLGGRRLLPATRSLNLRTDPAGKPLRPAYARGFEYSDCWVDDARLVVLNARDAADRGAAIRLRTTVTAARREGGHWRIALREADGRESEIAARLLVNAGGPWVDRVLALSGATGSHRIRLVQGSHIVVPRLYAHDRCYIFQNADGRIVFAIPYEDDYTLIGTTDRDYMGDPADVAITEEEIDYLCAAAGDYFQAPVRPDTIVWHYAGVRPLYDDGASSAQEATRDYVLHRDGGEAAGVPALVSIFGGKLTTYRRLAEAVLSHVEAVLGARGPAWTKVAPLPGGDFPVTGFDDLAARLQAEHPFLTTGHARRLARLYGTRAWPLLDGAQDEAGLGRHFGADLYQVELRYLVAEEWAATAEDVLWRRTKLGLRLDPAARAAVAEAVAALHAARPGLPA